MISSTMNNTPGEGGEGRPTHDGPYDGITQERASSLLRMGLHGPRKAADDLADELEQCDGTRWLETQFRRSPFVELPHAGKAILSGEAGLEALTALKERSKQIVKKPATREAYLAGLAGYYLSIASALVHHHARITRQSKEELSQVLQDLAAVTPQPWSDLLLSAAKLA